MKILSYPFKKFIELNAAYKDIFRIRYHKIGWMF